MIIKYASKEDVEAISAVESECFPPSEAATEKEFVERVKHYGNVEWHQMRLTFWWYFYEWKLYNKQI